MGSIFEKYAMTLTNIIGSQTWDKTELLAQAMLAAWQEKRQLFLCGNGGSAGNAIHLANDLLYGIASKVPCAGMRVEALPINSRNTLCNTGDFSSCMHQRNCCVWVIQRRWHSSN